MNFDYYQTEARKTAIYPDLGKNLLYPTLGLCGEAGEVAEKIKKIWRDHDGLVTPDKKQEVAYELGDVLWYLANIASELGYSLSTVAAMNLSKLSTRAEAGKLHGSGDNR